MQSSKKFLWPDEENQVIAWDSACLDTEISLSQFQLYVSIAGIQSIGKSTFMNTLARNRAFYVEEDAADALDATTKGIDVYAAGSICYLDVEGCCNYEREEADKYELKLFTLTFAISDAIILLIRDNDHTIKGGFFTNFLTTIFYNSIDSERPRKSLLVVIRDRKPNEKLKEKILNSVKREWANAIEKKQINLEEQKFLELDLDDYFALEVFFILFDEESEVYRENYVEPVRTLLENITPSKEHQLFLDLTNTVLTLVNDPDDHYIYVSPSALTNFLQLSKRLTQELHARCTATVQSNNMELILDHKLLLSQVMEEFRRELDAAGTPKPLRTKFIAESLLYLEETELKCHEYLVDYYRLDILYYLFKLKIAELRFTIFEKFKYKTVIGRLEEGLLKDIEDSQSCGMAKERIRTKLAFFEKVAKKNFLPELVYSVVAGTFTFGGQMVGLKSVMEAAKARTSAYAECMAESMHNGLKRNTQLSTD